VERSGFLYLNGLFHAAELDYNLEASLSEDYQGVRLDPELKRIGLPLCQYDTPSSAAENMRESVAADLRWLIDLTIYNLRVKSAMAGLVIVCLMPSLLISI